MDMQERLVDQCVAAAQRDDVAEMRGLIAAGVDKNGIRKTSFFIAILNNVRLREGGRGS
jgi:hypothetical protein